MKTNGLKWAVTVVVAAVLVPVAALAQSSSEAKAALTEVKQMLGATPAFIALQPEENIAPFWEQVKTLALNPNTALSGKTKELIGLGVSAQIPCKYCVYAHTEFAKLNGANDREIREAVATAGMARELSAMTQGQSADKHDEVKGGAELAGLYQDIDKTFGPGHDAFKRYPVASLPSLWKQVKAVTLNPAGAMSVKEKLLVSLAVSSQTPSAMCVKDYTAAARANGATEQEIQEAVAIAAYTRASSTVLNGMQVDESVWKKDIDAVIKHVTRMSKKTAAK
jgi:AhpD family alkylhydroperoxidase